MEGFTRKCFPVCVKNYVNSWKFTVKFSHTQGDYYSSLTHKIQVVDHIINHWREFGPFVQAEWNISSLQEYYRYMSANGTFASELECQVATTICKMNLSIYRETGQQSGSLERIYHNHINSRYNTARLLFSGRSESGHYDVLTQVVNWKENPQFCKLIVSIFPLTSLFEPMYVKLFNIKLREENQKVQV